MSDEKNPLDSYKKNLLASYRIDKALLYTGPDDKLCKLCGWEGSHDDACPGRWIDDLQFYVRVYGDEGAMGHYTDFEENGVANDLETALRHCARATWGKSNWEYSMVVGAEFTVDIFSLKRIEKEEHEKARELWDKKQAHSSLSVIARNRQTHLEHLEKTWGHYTREGLEAQINAIEKQFPSNAEIERELFGEPLVTKEVLWRRLP